MDLEGKTTLESSESYLRIELPKEDNSFKLRHETYPKIKLAIGVVLIGLLSYTGYRMVKSGNSIIEKHIQRLEEYIPIEK